MKKPPPGTYPNRIAEFRNRLQGRVTQKILADASGVTQPTFQALEAGQTRLTAQRAFIIAPLLECDPWELSADLENALRSSNQKSNKITESIPLHAGVVHANSFSVSTEKIPVLGHANGSRQATIISFDNVIDRVSRPPSLEDVKEAFAVYAVGDSMSPRYYPGEVAYVAANRPPKIKQDCLVEMANGEAYLKIFKKWTKTELICEQLNPAKEWKRLISDVKTIHAIVR